MSKTPKAQAFCQVAALCWRVDGRGALEVLMVTSRERGRWIMPKGWPIKGLGLPETAETEAMEEAGVIGRASRRPIGTYTYEKRLARRTRVSVAVYAVAVERMLEEWLEKGQREIAWLSPDAAAARAADAQIARLILDFGRNHLAATATVFGALTMS